MFWPKYQEENQKIFKEFQKSFRLGILRLILRYREKQGFRKRFQHRELVKRRGVEHHVRVLLEGEDMLLLPVPDRLPPGNRLHGGKPARSRVPHHPADFAVVGGGNAVVLINVEGGDGADINFEFIIFLTYQIYLFILIKLNVHILLKYYINNIYVFFIIFKYY